MRMMGWCSVCGRVRNITINWNKWLGRGVPQGVCDDCYAKGKR